MGKTLKKKRIKPLLLHPSQGEVFFDKNRFKVLACGRRWGKALDVDTPILTTRGWKTMGTVKEGDYVFSPSGNTTRVIATTEEMQHHPCYEITFSDGEKIVADENHLWKVWSKPFREKLRREKKGIVWQGNNTGITLTTSQFSEKFYNQETKSYWAIPNTSPLESPRTALPIDPFIFGVWLVSDNSHKCSYLKIHYDEVVQEFINKGYDLRYKGVKFDYYCSRLKKEINDWGFYGQHGIPDRYFSTCLSERLRLLQGVIEGAGYKLRNGKLEIKCKSQELCRDLVSLFYSVGQKIEIKSSPYHRKGVIKHYYRLCFRPCQGLIPTRYRIAQRYLYKYSQTSDRWRFIRGIRKVATRPVRCIEVDSPHNMFCVGRTFVPTHNSRLLLTLAVTAAINFDSPYDPLSPPHCLIAMPTLKQARSNHWLSLLNLLEGHPAVDRIVKSDFRIKFKGQKPDLILRGTNEDGGDNLRGLKLYFAGLDEFQDVKQSVWESVIRPALSDTVNSSALITGTPKGRTSFFHYLFSKAPDWKGWSSFTYFSSDNPFLNKDEIENARASLPPRIFSQEFEASFVDFRGKIFTELCSDHLIDDEELPYFDQYVIGIDWGDVNPAIVVFGIPEPDYRGLESYYLIDIWKNPHQKPKEAISHEVHNAEIMKRWKDYRCSKGYADPSQPGRILSLRKAGVNSLRAGYNRVEEGNGVINILLSQKRLFFARSCKEAFFEAEAYHRKEKEDQILEEVAPGQEDHLCFAGDTEVLSSDRGWVYIRDVKLGERMLTSQGYGTVENLISHYAPVQYFPIADRVIESTPDHPVFLSDGSILPIHECYHRQDLAFQPFFQGYQNPKFHRPLEKLKKARFVHLWNRPFPPSAWKKTVYNLTVSNGHNYYIRVGDHKGLLVSNCDAMRYVLASREHFYINNLTNPANKVVDPNLDLPPNTTLYGGQLDSNFAQD